MYEKRILVVDDAETAARYIRNKLESVGYNVTTAQNGRIALQIFRENPFPVVITDIEMPEMDGIELVENLNKFPNPPVIFIETSHSEPSVIIDLMKKGVYDYLLKPIDIEGLPLKVKSAFESAEMKRHLSIIDKEKIIRLENQLEWYRWVERYKNKDVRDQKTGDRSLFHRLQTVFNQGTGFGTLVGIIDILSSSAVKEDRNYVIDAEILDLLIDNAEKAKQGLSVIKEIDIIAHKEIDTERISFIEYYDFLKEIANDFRETALKKNQEILLSEISDIKVDGAVDLNKKYMRKACSEILLNACKFSANDSNIIMILQYHDDSFVVSILSTPAASKDGESGIPMEYENIIFEPFFRLSKIVYDDYNSLDYGLGLAYVENIVKKHKGKISVSNVTDYTEVARGSKTRVNFTLSLPVRQN